jgi:GTP-binding protein
MFIDKARIRVRAGRGGDGCLSFRREKYVERGGPDGGNGGPGGDVWLTADPRRTTLHDLTFRPLFKAEDGGHGLGGNRTGRTGEDVDIRVPPGTLLYADGALLHDLKSPGDRYRAAHGGRGGRGNASFKTAVNTAPRLSEKGAPGEAKELELELKLLADVGLVGLPNAGKSTLLARVSAAKPKIADYPFTTLTPNLGVVRAGDRHFVMADIPGLIEGAHRGKGLGDEFLRHVERTRVLIHLVDVAGSDGATAAQNFRLLNRELASYSADLARKPQITVATKMDLTGADKALAAFRRTFKGRTIYPLSAATGRGVEDLLKAVAKALATAPEIPAFAPAPLRLVIPPPFTVKNDGTRFRVSGPQIQSLLETTRFDQDEAVARLQKILRKMGVEKELEKAGITAGQAVALGDYEFTYQPEPPGR